MTDKTATQNLTRTQASDDPRRMSDYLAALAGDVDQRIAAHYFHLGRSQKPPAAMIQITAPATFPSGGPGTLVYDTVAFDTAGLVDLSADARVIALTPGYWSIGAYFLCNGFGGAPSDGVGLWLQYAGSSTITAFHDIGGGSLVGGSWSQQGTVGSTNEAACGLTAIGTTPTNPVTTVSFAALWAYKIRDL